MADLFHILLQFIWKFGSERFIQIDQHFAKLLPK